MSYKVKVFIIPFPAENNLALEPLNVLEDAIKILLDSEVLVDANIVKIITILI